jgi:hypothetical protein
VSDSLLYEVVARLCRGGWRVSVLSVLSDDERRRTRVEGVLDLLCVHEREREIMGVCVTRYASDEATRSDIWPNLVRNEWLRAWVQAGGRFEVWCLLNYCPARKGRGTSLEIRRCPVTAETLTFLFDEPAWPRGRHRQPVAATWED